MIIIENVHKRYQTPHGVGRWILKGINFVIPANVNVGLIGRNGAGKSTLLNLIGGIDMPTRGSVERCCRVSWPMGYGGGLQGSLTGRQNAKFVCRLYGFDEPQAMAEKISFVEDFAELGLAFDEPVRIYSSGMKSRLQFGLSLAFDFDIYISDEATSAGDASFKKKASEAFKKIADRSGLIMVSHSDSTLRQFCQAGVWLHEGQAYWFDKIEDALKNYQDSIKK